MGLLIRSKNQTYRFSVKPDSFGYFAHAGAIVFSFIQRNYQLALWIWLGRFRSADKTTAALGNHVSGVVQKCSQNQMICTNAERIVATMKNDQFFGNGTMLYFPRKTMSSSGLFIKLESTIATLCFSGSPKPARTFDESWSVLIHFAPKSFFNSHRVAIPNGVQ